MSKTSGKGGPLDALERVLIDGAAAGGGRVGLGQLVLGLGSVKGLFKDRIDLVHVELGLEVLEVVEAGRVGAAMSVGHVELIIHNFITRVAPEPGQWTLKLGNSPLKNLPVALAAAILLGLLGVLANMAVLGKEARKMLLRASSAVSQTGVVLVVVLKRVC